MKTDQQNTQPSLNLISEGSQVTGTYKAKSELRISGKVEGDVHAEGKCIVAKSGEVSGDLHAPDADIAGKVDGEIHVSSRLILRQGCEVSSDVTTKTLMVEEGARFDGSCRMDNGSAGSGKDAGKQVGKQGDSRKGSETQSGGKSFTTPMASSDQN